ncbi:hypothetical protein AruPA_01420 [Acidiphilium sp. PA]|uniref:hypothetical protein n=1 Tax=Acidiphilium sp. PA TaxID=2871705 RepID=UPI00224318FC|nr:hypothetical protein [Acidiphilium sp. PA]MCW8305683.1 hypothetical protein [Acidiphilium sp. PA]
MIEVVFGGSVAPGDAVLIEGDAPAPAAAAVARFVVPDNPLHGVGCACCAPRGPASEALSRLFLARARGEVALFTRVVVLAGADGVALVRAALAGDAVTRARFRGVEISSD